MSTETEPAGIDPQVLADLDAVMRRIIDGTPVDPEISRRIRERAEHVTEEIYRTQGDVDVNQLLHDSRDPGAHCSTACMWYWPSARAARS